MIADETINVFRENTSLGSIDVVIEAVLKLEEEERGRGEMRRKEANNSSNHKEILFVQIQIFSNDQK